MDDNTTLIAFKAISKFVKDLADEFGKKYHGLELYNHLIQKTTIAHEGPVAKHVDAFHRYCVANREGIVEKDILGHPSDVDEVVYSDKVRFNVREILGVADDENKDIKRERNYPDQPPTIPHAIRGYQVDKNGNKCLTCHSRAGSARTQAPMISITHYMDRDGQPLAAVSPRRYFCTQCHVPQKEVKPLVGNDFRTIDQLLQDEVQRAGQTQ